MKPIATPSLRLRHIVPADAPLMMALNAEASTRHWLPSHVYATLDEARARLETLMNCYTEPGDPRLGPYVLAVEHGQSGQLLGHVGFSPFHGEVEVSYAIAESARGRGYGTQALVHACHWVSRTFSLPRVLALTACENVASRIILERASFAHLREEMMRFQGVEQEISRYCWTAGVPDQGVQ